MPNWRNVLVYADGRPESSLAVAEALRLAEHVGGKATALDVLHYFPARVPTGLLALEEAELLSLMQEQRREQLLEELDQLRLRSQVDVQVMHGNPAFELIRQAVRGKHDLIVKTARGRDVRHMTSFGSTALHLVRKSPAPVLLVSPQRALLEAAKVLCALELDDTDRRQALNRSLLAASRQLAAVYGADLHVVHVVDTQRTGAYRAFLTADTFQRFAAERQRLLQEDLERLLQSELSAVPRVHAHLLEGSPPDQLVDMVAKERISHLVMGSVAHSNPGHLMGSLVEEVLTRVECSVLTLKPADFKSPVATEVPNAA
ncbi:MAG TPA: universal stress protein [Polyangiaceae bacterium]|nr:universal stress protein [Polyangiaceae bacterium]